MALDITHRYNELLPKECKSDILHEQERLTNNVIENLQVILDEWDEKKFIDYTRLNRQVKSLVSIFETCSTIVVPLYDSLCTNRCNK